MGILFSLNHKKASTEEKRAVKYTNVVYFLVGFVTRKYKDFDNIFYEESSSELQYAK